MNTKWDISFTSDPPDIMVHRALKYGAIREAIERIVSGENNYLVIQAEDTRRAYLIAASVAAYRTKREIADKISYVIASEEADGTRKVVVWNPRNNKSPVKSA